MNLTSADRNEVLRWASNLVTDPTDVLELTLIGDTLVAWLEAAADEDDLATRLQAGRRHHANLTSALADGLTAPQTGGHFIRCAEVLVSFITGPEATDADKEAAAL